MKFDVYGVFEVRKYLKTVEADDESFVDDEDIDWPDLDNLDNCQIELDYVLVRSAQGTLRGKA